MSHRTSAVVLVLALAACTERPLASESSATDAATSTGTGATDGTSGELPPSPTLPGTSTVPDDSDTAGPTGDPPDPTAPDDPTGSSFIIHDYGHSTKECDPWVQDCPMGQKCMPYDHDASNSWNALKCVDVVRDPAGLYEPCSVIGNAVSGEDTCDVGLQCWDVDFETNEGICHGMCIGSPDTPDCEDPQASCTLSGGGVLILCLPHCDPLAQDCPNDDLCIPNPFDPDGFLCVLDASGEEGQAFDPCEYTNACDKGLYCLDPQLAVECAPMGSGCCLPFCDTGLDPDLCPGQDQICIPWFDQGQAPPGYENLGVCGLQP